MSITSPVSPLTQEETSVKDLYTTFSENYEQYVQSDDIGMQTNGVMVDLMRRHWPQSACGGGAAAANVVDIGCGTGLIGKLFMEQHAGAILFTPFPSIFPPIPPYFTNYGFIRST